MAVSIFKGVRPAEDWSQLGESIRQSQNRSHDLQLEQQRHDENQRQKSEAEYLSLVNVPPEQMISNELQKMQGDKMQQFVELAGKEYRDSNYKPNLQSKIKMQQARNLLVGWQNKIKSNEAQWNQAYSTIKKDKFKGDYDDKQFWDRTHDFYQTGELPDDLLTPKSYGNLAKYFIDQKVSGKKEEWINAKDNHGQTTTKKITRQATDDERKQQMSGLFFDNPRLNKTAVEEFSKLPPDQKKQYLEKAPEDNKGEAVTDWMFDNYGKYFGAPDEVTSIKPTASPFKFASQNKVQVLNYDDSDKLAINLGKYQKGSNTTFNKQYGGKEKTGYIQSEGGVAFSGEAVTTIQPDEYYDLKHTELQKSKSGKEIKIKDISIKYYPIDENSRLVPSAVGNSKMGKVYLDKNGNVKSGYKLQAMLITSPNSEEGYAVPLTDNLKQQLKTKYPQNASQIDDIDLEKTQGKPEEGVNTESAKTKTKTYKAAGKSYTHQNLLDMGYSEKQIQDAVKAGKLK